MASWSDLKIGFTPLAPRPDRCRVRESLLRCILKRQGCAATKFVLGSCFWSSFALRVMLGEHTGSWGVSMRPSLCGVGLALLALTAGANAQSLAAGLGAATCAQFAQAYAADASSESQYFSWAQGWLSGLNSSAFGKCGKGLTTWDLGAVPADVQKMAIRQYCWAHPLDQYARAVVSMRSWFLKPVPIDVSRNCKG